MGSHPMIAEMLWKDSIKNKSSIAAVNDNGEILAARLGIVRRVTYIYGNQKWDRPIAFKIKIIM